jgi:REase_AHJR-like
MITPKESPPRELLERIAEDYRRRGFEVLIEPKGKDLPEFLADATPDMIANRANEYLVIEVKRAPKAVDPEQVAAISKRLAAHPGWRLVLMAPEPPYRGIDSDLLTLDEQSIKDRFDEASTLIAQGHAEAALMLAWSATEALLRLIASRYKVKTDRLDPAALLRALASEGVLNSDDLHQLNSTYQMRSAFAHGLRPSRVDMDELARATNGLGKLSKRWLRQLPKAR